MIQADIDPILAEFGDAGRDALIPILQAVQERNGYLSRESMEQIGRHLDLPVSKVYGVATFYNQFRFQPRGKFHIQVCRGTACHVKGSAKVRMQSGNPSRWNPGRRQGRVVQPRGGGMRRRLWSGAGDLCQWRVPRRRHAGRCNEDRGFLSEKGDGQWLSRHVLVDRAVAMEAGRRPAESPAWPLF